MARRPFKSWFWFVAAAAVGGCVTTTTAADTARSERAGYTACVASCRNAAAVRARQAAADPDAVDLPDGGTDTEEVWCRSDCVAEYRPNDPAEGMQDAETGGVDTTQMTIDMPPAPPPGPAPAVGNE